MQMGKHWAIPSPADHAPDNKLCDTRGEIDMHTDKTDAEFEAWWQQQLGRTLFEDVKDQMRNVWRASRAEMVIQLPDPSTIRDIAYYRADVQDAIEAAGVTVRG